MNKKKRTHTLKWKLIWTILLCWVVPMSAFAFGVIYYINDSAQTEAVQMLSYNFENAVNSSHQNLEAAANLSRSASYDDTIRNSYSAYSEGNDKLALYDDVMEFLTRQYHYENRIIDVQLFFTEDPSVLYTESNYTMSGTVRRTQEYKKNIHPQVQELYPHLGTDIRFLYDNGVMYMIRNIMDSKYNPIAVIVFNLNTPYIFSGFSGSQWDQSAVIIDEERVLISDGGRFIKPDSGQSSNKSNAASGSAADGSQTGTDKKGDSSNNPDIADTDGSDEGEGTVSYKIFEDLPTADFFYNGFSENGAIAEKRNGAYYFSATSFIDSHQLTYLANTNSISRFEHSPFFIYATIFAAGMAVILLLIFNFLFRRRVSEGFDVDDDPLEITC